MTSRTDGDRRALVVARDALQGSSPGLGDNAFRMRVCGKFVANKAEAQECVIWNGDAGIVDVVPGPCGNKKVNRWRQERQRISLPPASA